MANNIKPNAAFGGPTVRSDENTDKEHTVYWKTADGTADSNTVIQAGNGTAANAARVTLASDSTGVVRLAASSAAVGEVSIGEVTVGASDLAKAEDAAHQNGNSGVMALGVLKATPGDLSGTDSDYEPLQLSAGRVWAGVAGNVADDATAAGNPVLIGAKTVTTLSEVAEADTAQLQSDTLRRGIVTKAHPETWRATDNQGTAQTATELVASPGADTQLMVTSVSVSAGAAQTVKLVAGSDITPPIYLPANGSASMRFKTPVAVPVNTALGYTSTAGVAHSVAVTGYAQAIYSLDPLASLKTGLVAWYDFESDLTDSHSGGLDMTLNEGSIAYASGLQGNAADVNATQVDVAVSGTGFDGIGSFSFATWVNIDTLPGGTAQFIARRITKNGSTSTLDWVLDIQGGGEFRFGIVNTSGTFNNINSATSPSVSTWYFLVCTYDSATEAMQLIVNDGTPETATFSGTRRDAGADFGMFELAIGTVARPMKGLCDSTGYWGRVLTAAEITALYASGAGVDYADLP